MEFVLCNFKYYEACFDKSQLWKIQDGKLLNILAEKNKKKKKNGMKWEYEDTIFQLPNEGMWLVADMITIGTESLLV